MIELSDLVIDESILGVLVVLTQPLIDSSWSATLHQSEKSVSVMRYISDAIGQGLLTPVQEAGA